MKLRYFIKHYPATQMYALCYGVPDGRPMFGAHEYFRSRSLSSVQAVARRMYRSRNTPVVEYNTG